MTENLLHAVVFDCDGVLVDTEPLHYRAFQAVLEPLGLGHDYRTYLEKYIGFDDRDAFLEAFREGGRELDGETLESLLKDKERALRTIIADGGLRSFPGVVETVRALARLGIPLAVASGALRDEVFLFLRALGIEDCFSVVVAADDVERSKPDPETYSKTLERLGAVYSPRIFDPSRCVAVEDTPAGIESAKKAGLRVIAVTNSFPREKLANADLVVEDVGKIIKFLGQENREGIWIPAGRSPE